VSVGEFCFEELEASSVAFSAQQLLGLYASGRVTGVALDFGYTKTTICPINESGIIKNEAYNLPVGGKTITEYICKVFNVDARYMQQMDEVKRNLRGEEFRLPDSQLVRKKTFIEASLDVLFDPNRKIKQQSNNSR
jgi:actin-related protein